MGTISKRKLKRRNRSSKIWVSFVVIVLVGVFSVQSFTLISEGKERKERIVGLEKQIKKEEQCAKELTEEEKYRQTKKYVEDYAHNKLGLVYPGEIIFKAKK